MTKPGPPRAGVIGHKVAYSRSPMIHGFWLRTLGIEGSYELLDVSPEEFPAFLRSFADRGYVGGNVTKPHKETAFNLVESRDDAAEAIGAVNTLWLEHGLLVGGNTDAYGFLANLDETIPGWAHSAGLAVVVGAGGAARAIVYALLGRGFEVAIVNRTLSRAQDLAAHFGRNTSAHPMAALPRLLPDARLLTNAALPDPAVSTRLSADLARLKPDAIVYDINYVPLESELMKAARRAGHRTVDGLGMLLHQAVPGFAKWFGVTPRVTPELRSLIEADIRLRTRPP